MSESKNVMGYENAGSFSAPAPSSDTSYGARLRFGLASILRRSERLVDGVISGYERMCTLDEADRADIYESIGEESVRRGDSDDAIAALEQALKIRPENTTVRYRIGVIYLEQGLREKAIEEFERAHAAGLSSFELHFQWADALAGLKRYEEAVLSLGRAIEERPHAPEAAYRLGVILDELQRYEEAVVAFARAIEMAPEEAVYHQSLGFALESMGNREEALHCFKRSLDLERRTRR
jgi:tetratricopeptide (TPR) repeat protein